MIRANIERGRLPAGIVDERSIADIRAADVRGHAQCHFFAGIGGMAYGLRLAGWPDDLPVWTGGFPCQDVSVAGRGAGLAGARSGLWYEWLRLIDDCIADGCGPDRLLIENVPALRTRGADDVLAALDARGYAAWPLVVGAWAVGAPHRRNRVWIVADRTCGGLRADGRAQRDAGHADQCGANMADSDARPGEHGRPAAGFLRREVGAGNVRELEHAAQPRLEGRREGLLGQAGDGLADADDATASPELVPGSAGREATVVAGSGRLADAGGERDGGGAALARREQGGRIAARWPSRPGEPQHEWERPRLVEFRVGGATDGLSRRLVSRANKAGLKGFGNAVVPQCVAAVARAWLNVMGESQ